jgi:hypothetical protein
LIRYKLHIHRPRKEARLVSVNAVLFDGDPAIDIPA